MSSAAFCPSCGVAASPPFRFCPGCGASLDLASAAPADPPVGAPRAGIASAWTGFRSIPWWGQLVGWLVLWPLLAGLFVSRSPKLARGAIPLGVTTAMVGSLLFYVPMFADPAPSPVPVRPAAASRPTPAPEPTPAFETEPAEVTAVVDGDTIKVAFDSGERDTIRFIGVDTPESTIRHDPLGAEASKYTSERLSGRTVWLERDVEERDRYGRLLAYVWLSRPLAGDDDEVRSSLFNARLLLDGYAQVSTFPPNVKYVDTFAGYQQEARTAAVGLWGLPTPTPVPTPAPTTAPTIAPVRPPAPRPVAPVVTAAPPKGGGNCHPSYPDFCIPPPPPDLNCPDVGRKNFTVRQPDPHGFDRDKDGIGCES